MTGRGTVVILARHGETLSNARRIISTQALGTDLTSTGRQQAAELGRKLQAHKPAHVYSSHLRRAVQTASIVAELNGLTPSGPIPDLREIDAGALDGRSDDDAYAQLNRTLEAWHRGDLHARIGAAGEDGYSLVRRVKSVLTTWRDLHPDSTVVGISHGGLIGVAIPHLITNGASLASTFHVIRCLRVS
ncbi:MAG: histidine phosphatase family protein [Mycolicibacterium sp.]|nr:histidine phosphatase family protein [Mycolicibacterium sp.]